MSLAYDGILEVLEGKHLVNALKVKLWVGNELKSYEGVFLARQNSHLNLLAFKLHLQAENQIFRRLTFDCDLEGEPLVFAKFEEAVAFGDDEDLVGKHVNQIAVYSVDDCCPLLSQTIDQLTEQSLLI